MDGHCQEGLFLMSMFIQITVLRHWLVLMANECLKIFILTPHKRHCQKLENVIYSEGTILTVLKERGHC
jgi:hypothetical protein